MVLYLTGMIGLSHFLSLAVFQLDQFVSAAAGLGRSSYIDRRCAEFYY